MSDADAIDVDRLARTPSTALVKHVVELAVGEVLAADATNWLDSIVFVTAGEIEVECANGARQRFRDGDIVCFAKISVRALRNVGCGRSGLLIVHRRTFLVGHTG